MFVSIWLQFWNFWKKIENTVIDCFNLASILKFPALLKIILVLAYKMSDNFSKTTKVHFKIVGSDCNFAHNFLVRTRVLIILTALERWWKKLDFTCKIKWKMKRESCQKWRWKNATHRNLIAMTFKFDKYVAAYLCIRPSQHLSI